MKPESRRLIHLGANFVLIPPPLLSHQSSLLFQQAIMAQGLEYQKLENAGNQLVLSREVPSPLQVTVAIPDSQIGQILVVAAHASGLKTTLNLFIQEAEAALNAFEVVWPLQNRQIIRCDATIRELYETESEHAFQELWEKRLGQSSQALAIFGRPIRGGGLRFVMDPLPNETDPIQIEVKIESFIRDTRKIFVETQFAWNSPLPQGTPFNIRQRLEGMHRYIKKEIQSFVSGEANDSR